MAAMFLEEALQKNVDESAVNAIVGTLENQLDRNSNQVQANANNFGSGVSVNNQISAINSVTNSGGTIYSNQKHHHGVANGEIVTNSNTIVSNNNNNNNKTYIINNNNNNNNIKVSASATGSVNSIKYHTNFSDGGAAGGVVCSVSAAQQSNGASPHLYVHQSSNMPKNEPVKLVYPAAGSQVLNMNSNRVTLTSQQLPNGTISLSQISTSQPQNQQFVNTPTTTMKATTIQQQQPQTLIIKNQVTGAVINSSTAPGLVTNVKTVNNQASPNIVGLPSGVQIVNVRPGAPQTQTAGQQKTVATVSPRVVISNSPQLVATRPPNITLNAIQGQPQTILLKNEQGQFQLLRIGPAPTGAQLTPSLTTSSANQTIRLQTVPASISTVSGQTGQTIIVNSTMSSAPTSYITTQTTPVASVAPVPALAQQTQIVSASQGQQTVVVNTTNAAAGVTAAQRNSLDNTKEKCRKFLTNLIELSKREPRPVENNVRSLIQDLVDAKVEPEQFCERLERLLNASPQPCLIGFLKKSLPLLRQSLVTKEIVIEGINAPSASVAFSGATITTQIPAQIRPVTQTIHSGGTMVGQTQIRMVTTPTATGPKIGQTTIRPAGTTGVRIQGPIQTTGPRLVTASMPQIRPGQTTIVQTTAGYQNQVSLPQPPALLPVSGTTVLTSHQGTQNSSAAKTKTTKSEESAKKLANFQSSFYNNQISSMYGDDDINDVAAMGGVNLAEESQRILGSTEYVGTQIRSCKDEVFLSLPALQSKIRAIVAKHGMEEPSQEVSVLISHACQERLKNIVEKLAVIAEHRMDIIKIDPRYEETKDVRGQLKFLEELDKAEQKRHEEQEREILMRAAKSRSKTEDPEQAKLKQKAKEMQRQEMEELRQRDANLTALQAIGPRKKPRLESDTTSTSTTGTSGIGSNGTKTTTPLRPRIKRVNLRDMLFYLEQEKDTCRSSMLHRAYLK